MLWNDDEEWLVYQNVEKKYLNCIRESQYHSWAKTHPKDRKFYTILARGLTKTQAQAMVDLTKE